MQNVLYFRLRVSYEHFRPPLSIVDQFAPHSVCGGGASWEGAGPPGRRLCYAFSFLTSWHPNYRDSDAQPGTFLQKGSTLYTDICTCHPSQVEFIISHFINCKTLFVIYRLEWPRFNTFPHVSVLPVSWKSKCCKEWSQIALVLKCRSM